MDNSIYIVLSKQTALFRQMDVVANNIANADTTGFKSDAMHFKDYLVQSGKNKLEFTKDDATVRNTEEGELKKTDRNLDVAIVGEGYFAVQTPLGQRYTRAGNFQLNASNELVTTDGYQVLGTSGQPIVLDPKDSNISITENGSIFSGIQDRGKIGVVSFANENLLEKVGGSLYTSSVPPIPASGDFKVLQGTLEGSNVKPITELTDMITLQRTVSTTSNLISDIDSLKRSAVQTLAKQN